MEIVGIILIIYGVFMLAGLLLQFPFFYNNAKSRMMIKMMGKTGFNVLIFVFGIAALIGGILILN
ncbi:MAG: hypothetical protein NUK62_01125 [Tenericutes bacterium]|jgi:hypothetical protein|nr:hypothetical protein [Mycoplasmatota bacterium]